MDAWRKSKKATSPIGVVIVLIVVAVAVPIAVAGLTDGLSFNFLPTERITFTNIIWGTNNANCQITIKNSGTADLSILAVRINGAPPANTNPSVMSPYSLHTGASVTFTLTQDGNFTHGASYKFTVVTTKLNSFGPYIKTAP